MSETMTGVDTSYTENQTLDQKWERTDKAHRRVAALKKRIAKRVDANAKDHAEIHDIKSVEGVA